MSRLSAAFFACIVFMPPALGAENLRMRDGVSFFHDLDQGFPIIADKMDDVALASGKPTVVFFGASGDLNTNRQAKRIVDLYKKYKTEPVKFVIVDVDNAATPQAKSLVKSYYSGYIPYQMLFDKQGKAKWNHTGEIESSTISNKLEKLL